MKPLQEIAEQVHHSRLYRGYLLLLLAAFFKQCLNYTGPVDSAEYLQAAQNLLQGHWSACGGLNPCGGHWLEATRRTPGFPLLILATGLFPLAMPALQLLPAALIPIWSLRLLRKLTASARAQSFLMLAFAVYPLQYFYSNLLMPEIWVQALLLYTVLGISEGRLYVVAFGLSALLLLKPVFIIFLPFAVVLLFVKHRGRLLHLLPIGIFLGISWLNQTRYGWFHYSSIAVENAFEYNLQALMQRVNSQQEFEQLQGSYAAQLKPMVPAERAAFMKRVTGEKISAHLPSYLFLHLRGCAAALLDPGRYDLVVFLNLPEGNGFMGIKKQGKAEFPLWIWVYLSLLLLWRLLLLVLAARWFTTAANRKLHLLLLVPCMLLIAAAGPVGSARYLFPVAPLIFVMAAAGSTLQRSKPIKHETHPVAE